MNSGELGTEFLNELAAQVAEAAREVLSCSPEAAQLLGEEAAVRAHAKFEKQLIYIAEGRVFKAARTHELIASQLGKKSAEELVREFGVSRGHIYKVAKRVTEAKRARDQATLSFD